LQLIHKTVGRKDKLGKQLQKDLGEIIDSAAQQLLPGVMVTVLEVEVTPDLGLAKVFLSFLNSSDKEKDLAILQDKKGSIRRYLAQKLKNQMRKIPDLQFYADDRIDRAARIDEILNKIKDDDQK
jgi:ribosome-binding factor A